MNSIRGVINSLKPITHKKNTSAVCFHKWKRKSYSLFAMLGKSIRIGVLAVVYVLSLAPLKAQNDTVQILRQQDYQLDEVEVRAERTPLAVSEVARQVTIITKKEIQAAGASSIADLLEQINTIDIRQRGPGGIQSDISINGGSYEQVMILLNGINITDPQTGHFHMDIPIPLESIERIEILSGSAARVLGPNSYSGAINIVTRIEDIPVLEINTSLGQYKLRKASIHGGGILGKMKFALSSQYSSTAGYVNNTDSKNGSVFITGSYSMKKQSLFIQAGMNKKAFGANSFYTPLYPDQYEETGTLFSSLSWVREGQIKSKQDLYIRFHEDEFHLFRDTAPGWYSGPNNHLTRVIGSHHNFWFDTWAGRTSFGADIRLEKLWSSVLGNPLQVEDYKYANDDEVMDFGGHRKHASIFLEQRWGGKRFQISGGFLTHLVAGNQSGLHFYPGVDISYRLLPDLKVYSNWSRSLRLPTFTELYYTSPTNVGNPDLTAESSWDYQIGLRLARNAYSLSSSVNTRWAANSIDWVRFDDSEPWQTRNITNLFTWNAGVRMELHESAFTGILNGLRMKLSYQYTEQVKEGTDIDSKYLLDYLKHKINWSASYSILEKGLIGLKVNFNDRAGDYTNWDDEGNPYQQSYEPFVIVDLNLMWQIKSVSLNLTINDVFDTEYADIGHIWQPGRWVMAGVGFRLTGGVR